MEKRISRVGVGSVLKVSAVLGLVVGIIVGIVLAIVSFFQKQWLEGGVSLVLAPVLYGGVGALVNALMAWIYNIIAGKVGGILISLEDR